MDMLIVIYVGAYAKRRSGSGGGLALNSAAVRQSISFGKMP